MPCRHIKGAAPAWGGVAGTAGRRQQRRPLSLGRRRVHAFWSCLQEEEQGAGAMALAMRSALAGQSLAFKPAGVAGRASRAVTVSVDAKKVCDLTGKERNKANAVCFSNKKSRKWQEPNLQHKKVRAQVLGGRGGTRGARYRVRRVHCVARGGAAVRSASWPYWPCVSRCPIWVTPRG